MTLAAIVSDTGPLISLEKLSVGYGWMQQIYGQILIPNVVAQELYQAMFPNWDAYRNHYGIRGFIVVVDMTDMAAFPGCERLDIGERQAIQLAWQKDLPLLI